MIRSDDSDLARKNTDFDLRFRNSSISILRHSQMEGTYQFDDPVVDNGGFIFVATTAFIPITVKPFKVFTSGCVEEYDRCLQVLFFIFFGISLGVWKVVQEMRSDGFV